ncbi:CDP-glucose 4,6-dehydratase [Paenibacillus rhizovicinus]|uniref:CDP-glucose 4,6-dehydratase n=1 Tax=Paenibacillus rhizovicinus TaxID=2704463 RepID=A0A6C0NVJ9_9BACL|nr:CDP-glucose 4,6-dehydratase [Paenibacillus rhizovicinus]QHW30141.1 CDP-glucose 4,6-dehydratase [Paenibacillus rhizovicinus]
MTEGTFWAGKRVLITGHTGFMGSWLTVWLERLGAVVTGYSGGLAAGASMYRLCGLEAHVPWIRGDIRDTSRLMTALQQAKPEIVFHLAGASAPASIDEPPSLAELFDVEVVGTAALLDAVRLVSGDVPICAVVVMTSDDCYASRPWTAGLRESDPLGGDTPAAASKACAELAVAAFRRAFFAGGAGMPAVATVRAGHLIGGGDFAAGRLVPDCVRAVSQGRAPQLPAAGPGEARPWLHVLEALAGCLALAQRLFPPGGDSFAEAWNVGPRAGDARTPAWLAEALCAGLGSHWAAPAPADGGAAGAGAGERGRQPFAAPVLDAGKAAERLAWHARLDARQAVALTAEWYAAWMKGLPLREATVAQIARYERLLAGED